MKSIRSFSFFLLVLIGSIAFTACNPIVKPELLPVLTTTEVSAITQTSATSGGNITSDAGSSVTVRGVCWSTKASPTIADSKTTDGGGIGSFTSSITGLTAVTTYYVRAYATTSIGTGYGGAYQITTIVATPTVTDADGNVYHTVKIGTQVWMVENLKTTKYNDGSSITLVTDDSAWANQTTALYCWYDNNYINKNIYGALYNWYTVKTGKLAPIGWHVPGDTEWRTLIDYLGGTTIAGGKLKETGTAHWTSPNTGATNEVGFYALPGGTRDNVGSFGGINNTCVWWSATAPSTYGAMYWIINYNYNNFSNQASSYSRSPGMYVRCIKD